MKKNRRAPGIMAFAALVFLSFVITPIIRSTTNLAQAVAPVPKDEQNPEFGILKVQSNPAGVTMVSPTTSSPDCYTVSAGTCGKTNWTSTKGGGIPTTTYTYPTTTTIGGTSYTLSPNSLTGCNQGTSGSVPNVCKVSVAMGTTRTISATYTIVIPPPASSATLNVQSIPAGVNVTTSNCFTVTVGVCQTTNWTQVKSSAMTAQGYLYPTNTTIGGVNYTINPNSLTGCSVSTYNSSGNVCQVNSVAVGATATISATYSVTPPPLPTCPTSAANQVQNSSFESVQPNQPLFIYAGSYAFLDPTGTPMTEVRDWTRMSTTRSPRAISNPGGYGLLLPPFAGSKVALLKSSSWGGPGFTVSQGYKPDGIVGTLSTPTAIGSTYLISAQISTEFVMHAPSFEMWLRNSATGADSAHIVQVVIPPQATHWTLFAGAITANAQYDRVVISYNQGKDDYPGNGDRWAQVDDVHVCNTSPTSSPTTLLPWWKRPIMLAGVVLVALFLVGGLITGLLLKKHTYKGIVTLVRSKVFKVHKGDK